MCHQCTEEGGDDGRGAREAHLPRHTRGVPRREATVTHERQRHTTRPHVLCEAVQGSSHQADASTVPLTARDCLEVAQGRVKERVKHGMWQQRDGSSATPSADTTTAAAATCGRRKAWRNPRLCKKVAYCHCQCLAFIAIRGVTQQAHTRICARVRSMSKGHMREEGWQCVRIRTQLVLHCSCARVARTASLVHVVGQSMCSAIACTNKEG